MQPFDPKLEELYVRWAQFASVSPIMRLHGHRNGGPPSDPICAQTNGDNEPWSLFKNSTNYDAFVAAIRWREQQRNYVMDALADWSATNAPVISPLWLLFPGDPVCAFTPAGEDTCAGAFMFGKDWLAQPVTQYQQYTTTTYLPQLPEGQSWVYYFTSENFGRGPANVTLPTPVNVFPLFYRERFSPDAEK
jgi:alpha-D-xyloside xylohydrolase